jgi:hypothetical protein
MDILTNTHLENGHDSDDLYGQTQPVHRTCADTHFSAIPPRVNASESLFSAFECGDDSEEERRADTSASPSVATHGRASTLTLRSHSARRGSPHAGHKRARGGKYVENADTRRVGLHSADVPRSLSCDSPVSFGFQPCISRSRSASDIVGHSSAQEPWEHLRSLMLSPTAEHAASLPPKKRSRVVQLEPAVPRSALKNGPSLVPRAHRVVRFDPRVKHHGGLTVISARFEKAVMDFFASVPVLTVATPVPYCSAYVDNVRVARPATEALQVLLPSPAGRGRVFDAREARMLLSSPYGHVLTAWEKIEKSTYGDRVENLSQRFPFADSFSIAGWSQAANTAFLAGLLGVDLDIVDGQLCVIMPGDITTVQALHDQQIAPIAQVVRSALVIASPPVPSRCLLNLGPDAASGWLASSIHHLRKSSSSGEDEVLGVPEMIESSISALRHESPAVPPPAGYDQAIYSLYNDDQYAHGDATVLRGMLLLAEDLEIRLRAAIIEDAWRKLHVSHEEECDSDDTIDSSLEESKYDDSEVFNHPSMEKANRLAQDTSASMAAAAYAEKQSSVSVPIVYQGGGASCKLGPQHLLLIHQFKMLLRHAVVSFPVHSGTPVFTA